MPFFLSFLCAAAGLRQALAATELFFSSDVKSLDTAALIEALDARSTLTATASEAEISSMLVKLPKEEILDQPLERALIASGLMASKSESFPFRTSTRAEFESLILFAANSRQHKLEKPSNPVRSRSTE